MKPRIPDMLGRASSGAVGVLKDPRRLVPGSKRGRILGAGMVVLVAVGALTPVAIDRLTGLPDGVVLRVADTEVEREAFEDRISLLEALYGLEVPSEEEKRDRFRRDAAKAVAVSMVLENAANERDIRIPEKVARDSVNEMIEQTMGPNGRAEFVNLLGTEGASEEDVVDEIRRQHSVTRLFEEIVSGADTEISGDDAREYYAENKDKMVVPEQRKLRNIVVKDEDTAKRLYDRAKGGADFASLVRENSLDQSTRKNDGDLGSVTREQLDGTYADAAFSADEKSLFGPVRTEHGWNVGQVLGVQPSRELGFEEVKGKIGESLRSERALETWRKWLAEQIEEADIQYADEYLPEKPNEPPRGPSDPAASGR